MKYFSKFFCIASPTKTLVKTKKKINKNKIKTKPNQSQNKKSAFILIKMTYQPTVDPTWKVNATCECPRCHRHRDAQDVTAESMQRYNTFLEEAELDTKNHQLDGMMWVLYHELCKKPGFGVRGGIIADEMGLGKTILMLGATIANFKRRTLIVVPPALLSQWEKVIKKFGLGLINHTLVFHGYQAKKATDAELKAAMVVLTTYGMIALRKKPSRLSALKWDRVIYDEAHHMRTPKTAIYRGARQLKSPIHWLVTGTPIQNKVDDLNALCTIMGLGKAFENKVTDAKKILDYHLLRRTKKSVGIELPPVTTHDVMVKWQGVNEATVAAQIHSHLSFSDVTTANVDQIIAYLDRSPLPMLTRARQTCILPGLLASAFNKMRFRGQIPEEIELRDIHTASKLTTILKTLSNRSNKKGSIINSRRKLVFCHYRDEIDALELALNKMNITVEVIDGRTKKRTKQRCLDYAPDAGAVRSVCKTWNHTLNEDVWSLIDSYLAPEVMLLQIQTACEGLNLQHFQEIYFTSPHWNPAVEDQAIARAHRIGQKRPVDVFHFVMEGFGDDTKSLDQYCGLVQQVKRELASSFIN